MGDEGAAVLLYSTDYAELIGCCDRVLVVYGAAWCANWRARPSPSGRWCRAR